MELAFSALLIFVLTLPGILVRTAYRGGRHKWKIPGLPSSFAEQVAQSLLFAALLHAIWCLVCWLPMRWLHQWPDLPSLAMMLLGQYGKDSESLPHVLSALTALYHPTAILAYLLSVNMFAFLVGDWAHRIIRKNGWDYSINWLRFDNPWFYLFNPYPEGAVLLDTQKNKIQHTGTVISAVVNHNGNDIIYRGLLRDYNFCADGSLHSVHLQIAERRPLILSADETKDFHEVDGDILILCYSEIKTFNIEYRFEQISTEPNTRTTP